MKIFLYLVLFSLVINSAFAQEKHFIFIQSENKLPFYVNLNDKIYSSTTSGYLIIPKLTAGSYDLKLGFAQNAFPEQSFQCQIENKDVGFSLKNFGEKGWGLFNLQNYSVLMATKSHPAETAIAKAEVKQEISFEKKTEENKPKEKAPEVVIPTVNEITKTDTVKMPEQKEEIVVIKEIKQDESTPIEKKVEEPKVVVEKEVVVANDPEKTTFSKKSKRVTKIEERKTQEGVFLSFRDESFLGADTIELIVPNAKNQGILSQSTQPLSEEKKETKDNLTPSNEQPEASSATSQKTEKKDEKVKFIDAERKEQQKPVVENAVKNKVEGLKPNANCNEMALEEDYAKLRKKMAGYSGDDKMIAEAKKQFKNKCYTTQQVQKLSSLFLSDEGRYKFFDEMYTLVADPAEYPVLEKEFIDPYFANRFKAILRN